MNRTWLIQSKQAAGMVDGLGKNPSEHRVGESDSDMDMDTIVVATDFSDASRAALQLGSRLASEMHARLLIVHVESPEIMYGGEELDCNIPPTAASTARQQLQQQLPTEQEVEYEHHLLSGPAASEIVRFAQDRNANLIVVGTHARSKAMRLLLGSVAESVVRHATCPVLTVKHPLLTDE